MFFSIAEEYNSGTYVFKECIGKCAEMKCIDSDGYISFHFSEDERMISNNIYLLRGISEEDIYNMILTYENDILDNIEVVYSPYGCEESIKCLYYKHYQTKEQAKNDVEKYGKILTDKLKIQMKDYFGDKKVIDIFIDMEEMDYGFDLMLFTGTQEDKDNCKSKYKDDFWSYSRDFKFKVKEKENYMCALSSFIAGSETYIEDIEKIIPCLNDLKEKLSENIQDYINITDDFKIQAYPIEDGQAIYGVKNGKLIYSPEDI